jgi:hypothetical protein
MTDRATLLALAERVEALTGSDRAISQTLGVLHSDLAVALGWHRIPPRFTKLKGSGWISPSDWIGENSDGSPILDSLHGSDTYRKPPLWLWSIDAAVSLIPAGWMITYLSEIGGAGGCACNLGNPGNSKSAFSDHGARTLAHSVTAAALRACAAEMED